MLIRHTLFQIKHTRSGPGTKPQMELCVLICFKESQVESYYAVLIFSSANLDLVPVLVCFIWHTGSIFFGKVVQYTAGHSNLQISLHTFFGKKDTGETLSLSLIGKILFFNLGYLSTSHLL
jgi:hypothetical protein